MRNLALKKFRNYEMKQKFVKTFEEKYSNSVGTDGITNRQGDFF